MTTTTFTLARAFSIVIRQLSALLPMLQHSDRIVHGPGFTSLPVSFNESTNLIAFVERRMRLTWDWLVTVMDATEGQLRFGCSLTSSTGGSASAFAGSSAGASASSSGSAGAVGSGSSRSATFAHRRGMDQDARSSGLDRSSLSRRPGPTPGSGSRFSSLHSMDSNAARIDFLSYMLSIMRSHNNEH